MTILAKTYFCRQELFLPAKTIFASPVFTMERKLFFFHHLAKTCQP